MLIVTIFNLLFRTSCCVVNLKYALVIFNFELFNILNGLILELIESNTIPYLRVFL